MQTRHIVTVFVLGAGACAPAASTINMEYFLPIDRPTSWSMTGSTEITGPLTNVEAPTTATSSLTRGPTLHGTPTVRLSGNMTSTSFYVLLQSTHLEAGVEMFFSKDDDWYYWHGTNLTYGLPPQFQEVNNGYYDTPIRVFPVLARVGESYSYSGKKNGQQISGTFALRTTTQASLGIGEVEAVLLEQSSPWDSATLGFWLARDIGLVQFQVDGASSGFNLQAWTTTRSVDRAYVLHPLYNLWDYGYNLGNLLVWDPDFGYLSQRHYPWTYCWDHGWIYCLSEDWMNTWLYFLSDGWTWTDYRSLPYIYVASTRQWRHL